MNDRMTPKKVDHGRFVLMDDCQITPRVEIDGARIDLWIGDRLIGSVVEERESVNPGKTAEVLLTFAQGCIDWDRGQR